MTGEARRSADEIWADDLLDRRSEAELLAGYIASILDRPGAASRMRAYTIAVDAGYGEGKTYFLQRLAEHLGRKHPVAFIDAWADDLADQPLVAITATLKAALAPYMAAPEVKSSWAKFLEKTGAVAKIAGVGLLKRGAGFIITQGATDLAEQVLTGADAEFRKAVDEKIDDAGQSLADDLLSGIKLNDSMDRQVTEFRNARDAMLEMKRSLSAVVEAIRNSGDNLPIVIVVDELDRCRPSYAIKLLEEVKHLFDVHGIVFLFGVHSDQLSRSVQGAYGSAFDGVAYLKRFINRRYSLVTPTRSKLISQLLTSCGLSKDNFHTPSMWRRSGQRGGAVVSDLIDAYAEAYGLSARDMFELIDILETAVSAARPYKLILPYILPLIVSHMKQLSPAQEPPVVNPSSFEYVISRDGSHYGLSAIFREFQKYAWLSDDELMKSLNEVENLDYVQGVMVEATFEQRSSYNQLAVPRNYPKLITAVGQFDAPSHN